MGEWKCGAAHSFNGWGRLLAGQATGCGSMNGVQLPAQEWMNEGGYCAPCRAFRPAHDQVHASAE